LFPQFLQFPADPGELVLEIFKVVLEIPGTDAPAAPWVRQVRRAVLSPIATVAIDFFASSSGRARNRYP
jgi:hypothetical protein